MNPNHTIVRQVTLAGLVLAFVGAAFAADHAEAPGADADPAGDVADLYATHKDGDLTVVLTYAGLTPAIADGGQASFDPDMLYGIHIDGDFDNVPDHEIWVRYGQNALGDWGMQVTGLPGTMGQVIGPVESAIADGGAWAWAGLADDPFFFDLTGFNDTVATGDLMFTGADSLAGANVTAITLQFPYASVVGDDGRLQMWATTSRKGGE
jgi:hypothetical protein